MAPEEGIEGGHLTESIREDSTRPTTIEGHERIVVHAHDHALSPEQVTALISDEDLARALADAVLAGDHERAHELAKRIQERAGSVTALLVLAGGTEP